MNDVRPCLSCAIVSGAQATVGGAIATTAHFHAHQDFAYPVPGLIIVASMRHFIRLDEMNSAETADLLPFLQRLRRAQTMVLGTQHTYYFYNEDTSHHFHVWMAPRHDWMASFGKSVESVRPALRHAAQTMSDEASLIRLGETATALRRAMS